jgi:hypothetical protein
MAELAEPGTAIDSAEPATSVSGVRVGHYAELINVIRARVAELGITHELVDELGGLAGGHFSKIVCDPPLKRMGSLTLFPILEVLGLQIALVDDLPALKRTQKRFKKKAKRYGTRGKLAFEGAKTLYADFLHIRAQRGGLARAAKMTYREARALGRRGARIRWAKARADAAAAQAGSEAAGPRKLHKKHRRRHNGNGHLQPTESAPV